MKDNSSNNSDNEAQMRKDEKTMIQSTSSNHKRNFNVSSTQLKERECLPHFIDTYQISVWSILRDCIGKDLSKITMPVWINEPISMLQKMSECVKYEELMRKAVNEEDSLRRLAYLITFCLS